MGEVIAGAFHGAKQRVLAALVVSAACGTAFAEIDVQQFDGGGSALVVSGTALSDEEKSALNNNTVSELWKTGTGTLVSDGISSFSGIIRVKGGIMQVAAQAGLGNTTGATYVENGATLEQTNYDTSFKEPMFLEGTGMDNKGAYFASNNTAKKSPGLVGGPITLTSDALLVGQRQWYLQPSELDMGGYTMTISNVYHQCVFKPGAIDNPGHIVVPTGTFWVNNGAKLGGTAANTITLTNNAAMSMYGYKTLNSAGWKIVYATKNITGNTFYISNTSSSAPSHWYGPVEVAAGYNFRVSLVNASADSGWHEFWGPIIGKGGLTIVNGNTLEGVRMYGTNTYEGVTSMPDSGQLWFMHRDALPSTDPAKFTQPAKTGRMYLPLREDGSTEEFIGWTAADLKDVYDGFDATTSATQPFQAVIGEGKTFTYPYDFDATEKTYNVRQRYTGGGTVLLTGDAIGRPRFRLEGDPDDGTTVVIDGSGEGRANEYGQMIFYDGRFLLKNVNHWFTSESGDLEAFNVYTRGTSPKSRVTFGSGTSMGQTIQRTTEVFNHIYDDGTCGVLELLDGCAFTNRLCMGYNVYQSAAVYQRGGEVYLTNGGGNDGHFGYGGYAFYENAGGELTIRGYTRLGFTRSGVGICHMANDCTVEELGLIVSAGGTGMLYQTSGTLTANGTSLGSLSICNANYGTSWGGHGNITVRGKDACVYVKNDTFYMSDCSISKSFINLMDGGTLRVAQVRKRGATTYRTGNDISNTVAYVAFNGGVLKSTGLNANIFGSGTNAPDRVTVFAGGAVLDTDAYTVTNPIALQSPEGKGITSIALPVDFDATGYVGPPVVTITGDGEGATAVCEFDSVNQKVTGITVTSPGWNYTTATVTLSRGGKSESVECTPTLAANATTGGLVKRGSGRLVLAAANTYGGKTRIEGGTLEFAAEGALPVGSAVELAGGGIAVAEGVAAPAELTVDLSAYPVEEGRSGRWPLMTLADGATAAMPTVHGLDVGWSAGFSGNTLLLRRVRGAIFSLR